MDTTTPSIDLTEAPDQLIELIELPDASADVTDMTDSTDGTDGTAHDPELYEPGTPGPAMPGSPRLETVPTWVIPVDEIQRQLDREPLDRPRSAGPALPTRHRLARLSGVDALAIGALIVGVLIIRAMMISAATTGRRPRPTGAVSLAPARSSSTVTFGTDDPVVSAVPAQP